MPESQEVPITGLVWRLSMRWRSTLDRTITPLGLTNAQYAVLAPLFSLEREGRRPSQRELADFTGLEPLYVSKLARGLEKAGLVQRVGHPDDTRAVQLSLTDQGRDVVTRAMTQVRALQAELTAPLGDPASPQVQALRQSLQRLLNAESAEPPAPLPGAEPDEESPQNGAES